MWQAWTNDLIIGIVVAYIGYTIVKIKSLQGWISVVMGLWLIISVFIPALLSGAGYIWNDLLSGILIMIAGFGALKNDTVKVI